MRVATFGCFGDVSVPNSAFNRHSKYLKRYLYETNFLKLCSESHPQEQKFEVIDLVSLQYAC